MKVVTGTKGKSISRREFFKTAAAATAGAVLVGVVKSKYASASAEVLGANERINVGIISCGGMSNAHINTLLELKS